jgi:peptide/nickel transport system substrate-binding protein
MSNEDHSVPGGEVDDTRDLPAYASTRRDFLRSSLGGAAVLALGAAGIDSRVASASSAFARAATPKRGGNLLVAMVGGTPADSLDADDEINFPQVMRNFALYNGLVALDKSGKSISLDLAEEITPSKDALTWTIRLKPGITFHNGKPLTAKDVAFTFRRITDPKTPHNGAPSLLPLDAQQMKILDARTLRLKMKTPYATFVEQICGNYFFGIVPVGYDPKAPVGTGPFKFKSFTPGKQSVFARNPNYHKHGLPYLD